MDLQKEYFRTDRTILQSLPRYLRATTSHHIQNRTLRTSVLEVVVKEILPQWRLPFHEKHFEIVESVVAKHSPYPGRLWTPGKRTRFKILDL